MSEEVKVIKPAEKYEVVVIDTLNSLQNDHYMSMLDEKSMVLRDEWKDFGVDVYQFYAKLRALKVSIVQVLGYEGSGKSYGIKYLNPETSMWIHTDKKPITFKGGKQVWKPENKNFTDKPTKYSEVLKLVETANEKRVNPNEPLIVFILGHIEDYKSENGVQRQRLKILGKLATKMNIEGSLSNCFYTQVTPVGDKIEYKLVTRNSGFNTARSLEDLVPTSTIDNNFQIIVDALKNY